MSDFVTEVSAYVADVKRLRNVTDRTTNAAQIAQGEASVAINDELVALREIVLLCNERIGKLEAMQNG